MYPTEEEKQNGIIPKKISVIGKDLVHPIRRFCSDLEVSVAPAFRYQHLWREKNSSADMNAFVILVSLPIMLNEAVHVLQLLANSEDEYVKTIPSITDAMFCLFEILLTDLVERTRQIKEEFQDLLL